MAAASRSALHLDVKVAAASVPTHADHKWAAIAGAVDHVRAGVELVEPAGVERSDVPGRCRKRRVAGNKVHRRDEGAVNNQVVPRVAESGMALC